jgi:hypothetical protein
VRVTVDDPDNQSWTAIYGILNEEVCAENNILVFDYR